MDDPRNLKTSASAGRPSPSLNGTCLRLEVLDFLNQIARGAGGQSKAALASLEERFHVKLRQHPRMPELTCLKYSNRSPKHGPPAECRGLLVRDARAYGNGGCTAAGQVFEVVCLPYIRFFNYGERMAKPTIAAFDWTSAQLCEKLDVRACVRACVHVCDKYVLQSRSFVRRKTHCPYSPSCYWPSTTTSIPTPFPPA